MKKTMLMLAAIGMMLAAQSTFASNTIAPSNIAEKKADWVKSADGTWAGKMDGKTYWYKLDKSANLWWSTDGKKWAEVATKMWADKSGKWLKIGDGKLWWSADKGKNWSEVPEWKWEGPNGEWYKFDKDWSLWVNKK